MLGLNSFEFGLGVVGIVSTLLLIVYVIRDATALKK